MNAVYSQITDEIIALLEAGTVPWRRPWKTIPPRNLISDAPYRGINILLLASRGFTDPYWLTYKQAQGLGGNVRKGEKGTRIIYYEFLKPKDADEDEDGFPMLRTYHVFNAEQCEGIDLPVVMDDWNEDLKVRSERAEQIICAMPNPPKIVEGGSVACYQPPEDLVRIPKIRDFESSEAYYATMFHELAHSTGHINRLNRPGVTGAIRFGSCDYSREELVAELASAFCCAEVGIDNSILDNAASYIHGWLEALQGDPKAVVAASSQAQRATNYILNVAPRTE